LNVYSNLKKSFKYAYGSMTKAEQQFSWKPGRSTTVTSGATFERFFSIPQGADLNAPVASQDQPGTILDTDITDHFVKLRYSNTGAYAQLQHALTRVMTVTLGARGDYNTRFGRTFNPRLGLVVRPTGSTTLKMLYGTAFLAPSPYQAYSHYGAFSSTDDGRTYASSYWHVPNPDLQPQKKRTTEVNLLHWLGGSVQLSGSAFYSTFTSLIRQSDAALSGPGFYQGWPVDFIDFATNEGHAYTYGGSIGADYIRVLGPGRRVELHASGAFVEGREWADSELATGIQTGGMSPVQLHVGGDLDWDSWSVAPRLSTAGTQRLLATTSASGSVERLTLPGYATLDLNIRRTVFDRIDAFLTLENVFDRRYRTINTLAHINAAEMIGVPQNPRRITIGFSLRVQ
jgi:iron complex outermembrane receptor protein